MNIGKFCSQGLAHVSFVDNAPDNSDPKYHKQVADYSQVILIGVEKVAEETKW